MKNRRYLSFIFVIFGIFYYSAANAGGFFKSLEGQPYAIVRTRLIAMQYVPVRFKHPDLRDACAGQNWCALYPEAVYCSGSGRNLCQFAFFNKGSRRYLAVLTYGETRLTVDRVYYLSRDDRAYWDLERH